MAILIRNMEMPKHCWQCPFHDDVDDCILLNQSCMKVWGETKHLDDCPLIEVPPHGRLIDADELLKPVGSYEPIHYSYVDGYVVPLRDISNAPTIIESEE